MNIYDLWFSTSRLSNKIKKDILKDFDNTECLYNIIRENYKDLHDNRIAEALKAAWNEEYLTKINNIIEKRKIKIVTINDKEYPSKLRNIDESPFLLYYYGDLRPLENNKSVAVVGTRECSNYGADVTKYIAKELIKLDVNIISGLARGIDTIAQRTCLESSGFTAGVLGCGIDVIYPKENAQLFKSIIEKGCLISEYPPGIPPLPFQFPVRNRIISGLSDLVLVVEATIKSGSLITARLAAEQGKEVVAVPGSIFSNKSRGIHEIIDEGAHPFIDMKELVKLMGINSITESKIKIRRNNNIHLQQVYDILSDTPMHIDDILRITNIDIKLLYELLLEMQLEDNIRCISGNYYVKVNNF